MRAQVATSMIFILTFVILLFVFMLVTPLSVRLSAGIVEKSEEALVDANRVFSQLEDKNIAAVLTESTTKARDGLVSGVILGEMLIRYGWVLLLVIIAIVLYLRSRMLVEYERRGIV